MTLRMALAFGALAGLSPPPCGEGLGRGIFPAKTNHASQFASRSHKKRTNPALDFECHIVRVFKDLAVVKAQYRKALRCQIGVPPRIMRFPCPGFMAVAICLNHQPRRKPGETQIRPIAEPFLCRNCAPRAENPAGSPKPAPGESAQCFARSRIFGAMLLWAIKASPFQPGFPELRVSARTPPPLRAWENCRRSRPSPQRERARSLLGRRWAPNFHLHRSSPRVPVTRSPVAVLQLDALRQQFVADAVGIGEVFGGEEGEAFVDPFSDIEIGLATSADGDRRRSNQISEQ